MRAHRSGFRRRVASRKARLASVFLIGEQIGEQIANRARTTGAAQQIKSQRANSRARATSNLPAVRKTVGQRRKRGVQLVEPCPLKLQGGGFAVSPQRRHGG